MTKIPFGFILVATTNYLKIMENERTLHRRCSFKQALKEALEVNFSKKFWLALGQWILLTAAVCSVKYAFVLSITIGITAIAAWIWAFIVFSLSKSSNKLQDLFVTYGLGGAFLLFFWLVGKLALMIFPLDLASLPFYLMVLWGLVVFIILFLVLSIGVAVVCILIKDYMYSVHYLVYITKWLIVFALLSSATWAFWQFIIPPTY